MFSDRHFSRTESWSAQARLCVFVTFTLAFGGLIASAWIMFGECFFCPLVGEREGGGLFLPALLFFVFFFRLECWRPD
ncbi:MAG: hypothetical protein BJ554DRAFT_3835, partial [Olpidium bornovanus]